MGFSHTSLQQSHSELLNLHITSHFDTTSKHTAFFVQTRQESDKPGGNVMGYTPTYDLTGSILLMSKYVQN